jgi:hypothetical protein
MSDALRKQLASFIEARERSRLLKKGIPSASVDAWMSVVVQPCPIAEALGARFYVGYNNQVDPPPEYVVGVDVDGSLHRIHGFEATDYAALAKRSISRLPALDDASALVAVTAYLVAVEGWQDGLALDALAGAVPKDIQVGQCDAFSPRASRCCWIPPRVHRDGAKFTVAGTVIDKASGRIECISADVSSTVGVHVVSRTVLVDQPRFVY